MENGFKRLKIVNGVTYIVKEGEGVRVWVYVFFVKKRLDTLHST